MFDKIEATALHCAPLPCRSNRYIMISCISPIYKSVQMFIGYTRIFDMKDPNVFDRMLCMQYLRKYILASSLCLFFKESSTILSWKFLKMYAIENKSYHIFSRKMVT